MIFHPHIRKISKYVDNTLGKEIRAKIEAHLSKCEPCRKKVQFLTKASSLVLIPKKKVELISDKVMETLKPRSWDTSMPVIGEIQSVTGIVTVRGKVKDEGVKVFPGLAIRKGDTLVTQGDSRALIRLNDGSFLYVNRETTLNFASTKFNLALRIGEIFAMMKPQPKTYTILTPSALLGVIGTEFDAKVTGQKQTILQVLKGKVSFKNNSGNTIVKKKQQVEAARDTQPVPIRIKDTRTVSNWTGTISTQKERENGIMKKLPLIIIILLILGAVGVGGYFLYNKYFVYEIPPYKVPESTTSVTAAPSSVIVTPSPVAQPQPIPEQITGILKPTPATVLPSNDTLVSRPPMRVGERSVFQFNLTTKSIINVPNIPRPVESREVMSQTMSVSILKEQPDGVYLTEFAILSAAMEQESPEGKITVSSDSNPPQNPKALSTWNLVKAMSGAKFYIYVTKDWDIVKIEGIEKMIEKMKKTCSPQIVQQMQESFNDETMKEMTNTYGKVLPDNPVKVGDDWSCSSKASVPVSGKLISNIKYKFVRWEEHLGRQCIVLEMSGSMTSKGAGEQPILGPKISMRDINISGTLWYDPVTGDTVESTINQTYNMDILQKIRDRQGFREVKMTGQVTNYTNSRLISSGKIK